MKQAISLCLILPSSYSATHQVILSITFSFVPYQCLFQVSFPVTLSPVHKLAMGITLLFYFYMITMGNLLFPLIHVAYKLLHQPLLQFSINSWHKCATPRTVHMSQGMAAFLVFQFTSWYHPKYYHCSIHLQGLFVAHIHSYSFKNYYGASTMQVLY